MKYLTLLLILTSCNVRWQLETPWNTLHPVMWNKPHTVSDIGMVNDMESTVCAQYPGFETSFTLDKKTGGLDLFLDMKYYHRITKVVREGDAWVGVISDKEFVRINPISKITILKFKGVHRIYLTSI